VVDELPRLSADEQFQFACHPDVPCFNACCRDLDLLLGPYDVLRLRRRLGLSSRQLFARLVDSLELPGTGFPAVALRMSDAPGRPCPFVESTGCSVYSDRPAACRIYPLGRGAGIDEQGRPVERWCVVREPHCRGFEQGRRWTSASWVEDQGIAGYLAVDDRYQRLVARVSARGLRLTAPQQRQFGVALYQLDRFGEILATSDLLDRWAVPERDRAAIAADEGRRLALALHHIERELLG
jgi:Fe-S-cluster containining protein